MDGGQYGRLWSVYCSPHAYIGEVFAVVKHIERFH